jgi:hypothetical protein
MTSIYFRQFLFCYWYPSQIMIQVYRDMDVAVRLLTCLVFNSFEDFRQRAALFDHTIRGALSSSHTPRFAGISNSGPCPSSRFERCPRQQLEYGGHFGKPLKKGASTVPGLQPGPKAKPPRLTYSIFPNDCHLPTMDSADRRFRPVI